MKNDFKEYVENVPLEDGSDYSLLGQKNEARKSILERIKANLS